MDYQDKYYKLKRKLLIDAKTHREERSRVAKQNRELNRQNEIMRGTIARLKHDLEKAQSTDYANELRKANVRIKALKTKVEELRKVIESVEGVKPEDVWMIEDCPRVKQQLRDYVKNH